MVGKRNKGNPKKSHCQDATAGFGGAACKSKGKESAGKRRTTCMPLQNWIAVAAFSIRIKIKGISRPIRLRGSNTRTEGSILSIEASPAFLSSSAGSIPIPPCQHVSKPRGMEDVSTSAHLRCSVNRVHTSSPTRFKSSEPSGSRRPSS